MERSASIRHWKYHHHQVIGYNSVHSAYFGLIWFGPFQSIRLQNQFEAISSFPLVAFSIQVFLLLSGSNQKLRISVVLNINKKLVELHNFLFISKLHRYISLKKGIWLWTISIAYYISTQQATTYCIHQSLQGIQNQQFLIQFI